MALFFYAKNKTVFYSWPTTLVNTMQIRNYISLLFIFTAFSFGAKIGLITGSQTSNDFLILNKYLKKNKIKTTIFDLSKNKKLPYGKIFAFKKQSVIRLIEKNIPSSYMSLEEADFWVEYLSSGGSLILIANHLGKQEVYDSRLLKYVGFSTKKADFSSRYTQGKAKGLIADGMKLNFSQKNIDTFIVPHKKSGVESIFKYENGKTAAMKQQSCTFRMSYFSFLPSWVQDKKKQQKLLENTIDWNLGFSLGIGTQAPDFPVLNLDGSQSGLYNQFTKIPKNNIIVLEFFATWCSSCETQLPRMVSLNKKYKNKEVSFFFIDYRETPQKVKDYLNKHKEIDWPISITKNGLGAKRYGVKTLPSIFLLDKDRKVRFIHKEITSQKVLEQEILSLMQKRNFSALHK
ncbi:MAG: hypothetical protein COB02_03040 [Candidatus Cloacimonadota bacterium]|nr:MAG: hypothetical protein COB02_03040 [Candidatus Cloacimonadota bacterium]